MSMTGVVRGQSTLHRQESKIGRLGRAPKTELKREAGSKQHLHPLDAFWGLLVCPKCPQDKIPGQWCQSALQVFFSDRSYLHYTKFYLYAMSSIMFMKCFLYISITSKLASMGNCHSEIGISPKKVLVTCL